MQERLNLREWIKPGNAEDDVAYLARTTFLSEVVFEGEVFAGISR